MYDGLEDILDDYDGFDWGFKRRERLDVKKPGPYYKINNYAFNRDDNEGEDQFTLQKV